MAPGEAQAWPGRMADRAKPRESVTLKKPVDDLRDLRTLTDYTTQELQLPFDSNHVPFEAVVTVAGEAKILDLQPYSMRSRDFQVLVPDEEGKLVPYENVPAPTTYRGTVRGEAGTRVSASLVNGQLWANIDLGNRGVWTVQPFDELMKDAPAPRNTHAVYRSDDVIPVDGDFKCGTVKVGDLEGIDAPPEGNSEGGVAGSGLEIVEIGCDADFEYYGLNGSSVISTMIDIENLLNSVEFIYERDVDLTFEITVIIVRSNSSDPYTSSNASSLLNEFASTWNSSPENGIRRDVAHLFTGRNISGGTIGIAVTPSTCFTSSAYSLVQSKYTGSFTLRQSLSAHELGHTLSAGHCDGNGDCHIMCSGNGGCNGLAGSNLKFGFAAVSQITNYANSGSGSCLAPLPNPLSPPFFDNFDSGSVLNPSNWIYNDGGSSSTAGVNEPSGSRSMNLDSTSSVDYGDNEVRTNVIQMSGQSNFVVAYYTEHRGVESGKTLTVEYWANNLRWTLLNEITSDGVDQDQFVYHQHNLPPSAHWNEFRVRFRTDGTSSSDDWYIDDVYVGPDPGLVFGACCLPDESCSEILTQEQCVGSGGTWQGDETPCSGADCTIPVGACCLSNMTCVNNTPQDACEQQAGAVWQGEGVVCDGSTCLPPVGVCCLSDGMCIDGLTESQCNGGGGSYQGDSTLCSGVSCPQPTGACCVDGDCVTGVTEVACTNSLGGTYQGNDSVCGDIECPGGATCIADVVDGVTFQPPGDGIVDGADLGYILVQWGANPGSPADIVDNVTFQPPPDGVVDGADLGFLLGTWGPCP